MFETPHVARLGARIAALLLAVMFMFAAGCGQGGDSLDKLVVEAKQQREAGRNGAAVIQLKNVLQKSPEHAEARYLLGLTYIETGDFRSAEKELQKALDLRYDRAKVIEPLARALLMTADFQKVLDATQPEGGADAPPPILALRGLATVGLGRVKEGREMLDQALAKQPDLPDALLGKARVLAAEKKYAEADALIEKAIAAAPKNAEAWVTKGDVARATGKPEVALAAYQKVTEFSPENLPARLNIASLHIASGAYDDASKQIAEIRKIAPGTPMALYMQALIEFRKGNHAAAREAVLQVLKVAPNHMPSTLLAGAVEYALGSQAQAQSYLGRVVERAPGNLYARKLLVSSLAKSGHTQRAIEALQPALKQVPEDAALLALAGEVYMQGNEFAKAGEYFDKAAKLDPKSVGARTGLGLSRLASGETDRAMADLESAAQLDAGKYQADILLVMSHLQRGAYDQALKAAQALEKKQPDNPLTHNLKAAIYIGKKDIPNARKQLARALELKPDYIPAATNLAQLDLQDKNPKAARARLEDILARDKDNVQALLALAHIAPQIGATQDERVAWLERARKAGPTLVQPPLMLARVYAQARDTKKALEAAQRAVANSPDNAEALDVLGAIQLEAGDKEQALATYNKLVTQQSGSHVALHRLAAAQVANANPSAAVATLRKALALKPDFVDAQVALVELELRAGRPAEAMKIAQQAQKQAAKSPLGFMLEGDVLMADKKFPQAAKAYETAYALGRSSLLAIKLHAAYAAAGKPEEGEARLAQRLKEVPEDRTVRMYAGQAGLTGGKYRAAIEQYEWVLAKEPDNVLALNNLAWAYQQMKDPRALATAERAHKLRPDNPSIADTLGWMLVEQGNTARGVELLQKAADAAPKTPEIRYHLAQAYAKAGDKAKARNELERLLSSEQPFADKEQAMALLRQLRN